MSDAPIHHIDVARFAADPYPDLSAIREGPGIAFVPELNATLLTRRDVIAREEKRIEVFSSRQPQGLMVRLMGENMLRKDGPDHAADRKASFPSYSPRTVRDHWITRFRAHTQAALDDMAKGSGCDLVSDYAMRVSGEALRAVTGLMDLTWREMDAVSQAMIDGISNYTGDAQTDQRARDAVARIDTAIQTQLSDPPPLSLLATQLAAGMTLPAASANIRLAISGGQNEPRDAIAGTTWALLTHPDQLRLIRDAKATWQAAFEEFNRWQSPVGMAPREIAQDVTVDGITLSRGDRVFLMYSAGNRDPRAFERPDRFDITRDTRNSLAFGAGPHFCAGAAVSRSLVAEIALPMLFDRFPTMRLDGPVDVTGWAFRGPKSVHISW